LEFSRTSPCQQPRSRPPTPAIQKLSQHHQSDKRAQEAPLQLTGSVPRPNGSGVVVEPEDWRLIPPQSGRGLGAQNRFWLSKLFRVALPDRHPWALPDETRQTRFGRRHLTAERLRCSPEFIRASSSMSRNQIRKRENSSTSTVNLFINQRFV
jgi:hypothetical protein